MNKKFYQKHFVAVLAASLLSTSAVPAFGAVDNFSVPVSQETAEGVEEENVEQSEFVGYEDEYEDEYSEEEVRKIEIVGGPKKTQYLHGLETVENCFEGLKIKVSYGDNSSSVFTFEEGASSVSDEWDNNFRGFIRGYEDGDEPGEIGTYQISVRLGYGGIEAENSVNIQIVGADGLPALNQNDTTKVTTVLKNDGSGTAWAKFIPERDGICTISSSYGEELNVYNSDYESMINLGTEDNSFRFRMKGGVLYYVSCSASEEQKQDFKLSLCFAQKIKELKLVKEPTKKIVYRSIVLIDGLKLFGGEVEVIYEDGTSEIISTDYSRGTTSRGDLIEYRWDYPSEYTNPDAGYNKVYFCVGEKFITFDVLVKELDELPGIKKEGSVTVDLNTEKKAWFRLETGDAKCYIIQNNASGTIPSLSVNTLSGNSLIETYYSVSMGEPVELKPNSVYYLRTPYGLFEELPENITFTVKPAQQVALSKCTITANSAVYSSAGSEAKVTVKYGKKTLSEYTDYVLTYSNNTKVGTGKVTITGKGLYTGKVTKTFTITPAAPAIAAPVKSGTKGIKVSWKKSGGATGYVVYRYAAGKWSKIGTTKKLSYVDSSVKKGSTCKYRVKAYTTVNKKTIYSPYSKTSKAIKR